LAHHKSAIKRIRQNEKKRQRNRYVSVTMRNAVRKLEQVIQAQQTSDAQSLLQKTIAIIDRAATKGVIHKNKASRSVSRLTQKVKALS
jgi:small subunit ribosomal protein S20